MRTGKVLALLLVTLVSCDESIGDVYRCQNPDKGHKDLTGAPDPCHRNDSNVTDAGSAGDAADAGETCVGVCLPDTPAEWYGPALVWMGQEVDAPPCPASASVEGFTARRPPAAPPCATTCTCALPSGTCALPATVTAASASCFGSGPGVAYTSSDPPANWSGSCVGENAIPAGQLCGGAPCVQSVTVAPLTIKETKCAPVEQPNVPPPPWGTFARACSDAGSPLRCTTQGDVCVPVAPTPEFRQCIAKTGDPAAWDCPPSYPDKSVFYKDFVDNRICTPCTCGAPKGSTCTGLIGLFSDAVCSVPLLGLISIDAEGPKCHDVPIGSALGSKSANKVEYRPGTCPVTGGQQGKIEADISWVICCQGTP